MRTKECGALYEWQTGTSSLIFQSNSITLQIQIPSDLRERERETQSNLFLASAGLVESLVEFCGILSELADQQVGARSCSDLFLKTVLLKGANKTTKLDVTF